MKPSAKERQVEKGIESRNAKFEGKESDCCLKGDFVKGQHVYYFPPKNHFLYNPKVPMCGPFLISKVHLFGAGDIILHYHKPITVYRKRLRPLKGSTFRAIWRRK